jgi:hypothetical protein
MVTFTNALNIRQWLRLKDKPYYEIDIAFKQLITLEEVRALAELAEKQVLDTLETSKIISERSLNFLTLTAGALLALVGFCIQRFETKGEIDRLLMVGLSGCAFLFVTSLLLVAAVFPKKYAIPGISPEDFFNSTHFDKRRPVLNRKRVMYLNVIQSYQTSMRENENRNKERWAFFKVAVLLLISSPIFFAVYYLLTK